MTNKKLFWILFLTAILSFIGILFVYPQLPETIPTNFDFHGNVNSYGPRSTLLFIGLLPAGIWILLWFLPKFDPKYQNYAKHQKPYFLITIFLTLFLILISWIMVFKAMGAPIPINLLLPVFIGILFLITGNFLPQVRPNYFLGIRTPWALDNEYVWKKTHKFGGILFCIMGILLILLPFLPVSNSLGTILTLVFLLGCSLSLYLYSYLIYRKIRK